MANDIQPALPRGKKTRNQLSIGCAAVLFGILLLAAAAGLVLLNLPVALVVAIGALPVLYFGVRKLKEGEARMQR